MKVRERRRRREALVEQERRAAAEAAALLCGGCQACRFFKPHAVTVLGSGWCWALDYDGTPYGGVLTTMHCFRFEAKEAA